MGRFKHEAAAADPVRKVIYLTEDETNGRFYRFVPTTWGDLSAGRLQVFVAGSATSGSFTWADIPDPDGSPTVTRSQVSGSKSFNGGEGCYYANNTVWFTTKGDNRVWQVNLAAGTYELAYDDSLVSPGTAPLTGVDNVTGSTFGDLYVAEDGGNMEICLITPDDKVSSFLRINGQGSSEITGPAFAPAAIASTSPPSAARPAPLQGDHLLRDRPVPHLTDGAGRTDHRTVRPAPPRRRPGRRPGRGAGAGAGKSLMTRSFGSP
ncbi:alkaline phosphatase PhoX [Streptosporangium lutulentum]